MQICFLEVYLSGVCFFKIESIKVSFRLFVFGDNKGYIQGSLSPLFQACQYLSDSRRYGV